jgi:hypothetical protein
VLVEAAGTPAAPGPLRAFHERIAARRGRNIATVAVARKLAVIAWHMLSFGEDYAFARPSLTREKIRKLELATGAQRQKGKRIGVWATREQPRLDKELVAQAELAYRRLVKDWQPASVKGTGAAPGRASCAPSSGQAARQDSPISCALARGHPRPSELSQRSCPPSSNLTSIRSGRRRRAPSVSTGC